MKHPVCVAALLLAHLTATLMARDALQLLPGNPPICNTRAKSACSSDARITGNGASASTAPRAASTPGPVFPAGKGADPFIAPRRPV